MVLNDAPVPLAGDPPVAVHAKVVGWVSPDADAEQLTAVPTVPVAGQVMVTTSAVPDEMLMVALADAVFALESVPVTLTV